MSLPAKQFLENLLLLCGPLHIFLRVAEPVSVPCFRGSAKDLGAGLGDYVRR